VSDEVALLDCKILVSILSVFLNPDVVIQDEQFELIKSKEFLVTIHQIRLAFAFKTGETNPVVLCSDFLTSIQPLSFTPDAMDRDLGLDFELVSQEEEEQEEDTGIDNHEEVEEDSLTQVEEYIDLEDVVLDQVELDKSNFLRSTNFKTPEVGRKRKLEIEGEVVHCVTQINSKLLKK